MSSQHPVLEVCVDSVQSAVSAAHGGADRLEICGNLSVGGGTTPSLGLVRAIQKAVPHLPLMVMIRPRVGDFLYSNEEMDVMLEDIEIFKSIDVTGAVFGVLNSDGTVDVPRTRRLVEAALPMQVCFHRAFDMTRSAIEGVSESSAVSSPTSRRQSRMMPAFDTICTIRGVTRILTSGHSVSTPGGLDVLQELLRRSREEGPAILPGAGINTRTILHVLEILRPHGLKEVHMSGGRWIEGGMIHRRRGMGMGSSVEQEWNVWSTDGDAIHKVRSIVDDAETSV